MKYTLITILIAIFLIAPVFNLQAATQEENTQQYKNLLMQVINLLLQQVETLKTQLRALELASSSQPPTASSTEQITTSSVTLPQISGGTTIAEPIINRPITPITIDFANPTQEMADYFYQKVEDTCNPATYNNQALHIFLALPQTNYTVQCQLTSDGTMDYPRGTDSIFINAGPGWLPLNWLKNNLIMPETKDSFRQALDKYSCEEVVKMVEAGMITVSNQNYVNCKINQAK